MLANRAFVTAGQEGQAKKLKLMALNEPDREPLWKRIR